MRFRPWARLVVRHRTTSRGPTRMDPPPAAPQRPRTRSIAATVSTPPQKFPWVRAVASLVILAWVCAGVVVLGLPRTAAPTGADVLLVLGPADERVQQAARLAGEGRVGEVAVSLPEPVAASPSTAAFCGQDHPYPVVCFVPEPSTTQGEARALAVLAAERGWTSVAVLSHRSHLSRADVLVRRCFVGDVTLVTSEERYTPLYWTFRLVYETGAWVKVALTPGC